MVEILLEKDSMFEYTKYLANRWKITNEHINKYCRIPIPAHEKLDSEFLLCLFAFWRKKKFKIKNKEYLAYKQIYENG